MLLTGASFLEDFKTMAYVNGACRPTDFWNGRIEKSLVLRDSAVWGESCTNLEFSLATL